MVSRAVRVVVTVTVIALASGCSPARSAARTADTAASTVTAPRVSTTTVTSPVTVAEASTTTTSTAAATAPSSTLTTPPTSTTSTPIEPVTTAAAVGEPTETMRPSPPPLATVPRCTDAMVIGDSTSAFIMPQIAAVYRARGIHATVDAGNGRSVQSAKPGDHSGADAIRHAIAAGFHGCWVVVLGTNDASNAVYSGDQARAVTYRAKAVSTVLTLTRGEPVIWVTAYTNSPTRPTYNPAASSAFNAVVVAAKASHPNLYVYDWAAQVVSHPHWLGADGIHYTTEIGVMRAGMIADFVAALTTPA